MSAIRVSMSVNVRGSLKSLLRSRAKNSYFSDDDGKPMTRLQAIDCLMDELAKGHECIPADGRCGNPCKKSSKCRGFDYSNGGGCPGYPIEKGGAA